MVDATQPQVVTGSPRWRSAVLGVATALVVAVFLAGPAASAQGSDNLADAVVLGNPASITVEGTNSGATAEVDEPDREGCEFTDPATIQPSNSVWYEWTAPTSDTVRVHTLGSDFDTVVAVYSGSAADYAQITSVGCNDQDGFGDDSLLDFAASAGTKYYIQLDGFSTMTGAYQLTISSDPCTSIFGTPVATQFVLSAPECSALETLYNTTNGSGWSGAGGWNPTGASLTNPCDWEHVSCDRTGIKTLYLFDRGLTGPIPPELGQLSNLTQLELGSNQLSGPIPPELSDLANVSVLGLSDNQLTGPIPPELGQLSDLDFLVLNHNQLTGPIPPELGQLSNLRELGLNHNQLTGPIPPELGQLSNLDFLVLNHNQLTGPIPPELGQPSGLLLAHVNHNQLTGPIPPELSQLSNLQVLHVNHNQLEGLIFPGFPALLEVQLGNNGCLTADVATEADLVSKETDRNGLNVGCDAVNDIASTQAGGSTLIDVTSNDGVPRSAIQALTIDSFPASGSVAVQFSASAVNVLYTSTAAGSTLDSFTYKVCSGIFCDTATVTITITPPTCNGVPATIWGTDAADALMGTNGPDVIVGLGGNDTIVGNGGADRICGNGGDDTITGGPASDRIYGGPGDDTVRAGLSVDRIFGGSGNDVLYGDGGSDRIFGQDGNDEIRAGSGADRVFGGPGDDMLFGMGGKDFMWGEAGNDLLQGNWQSDELHGGPGNDDLRGAGGKDKLWGDAGNDELYGGLNTDYLNGGPGTDFGHGQKGKDNPLVPGVSGCELLETKVSC